MKPLLIFLIVSTLTISIVFAASHSENGAVDTKAFETICSDLESVDLVHTINYGRVLEMCLDDDGPAVFMIVEANTYTQLTVEIPKTMVYSVNQDCRLSIVDIISDWGFPSVTMKDTTFTRIFTIDIPKGYYNEIKVYSSYTLGDDVHQYCGEIYGYDSQYLPPKKQVDKGRLAEHVRCNEGLELIFKSTDGSPACVTVETAIKLDDRGWTEMIPPCCLPMDLPQSNDCSGTAACFTGTITRIIDGDTIHVDGKSIRFSLASTPELNEPGGLEAKQLVEQICPAGSEVLVDEDDLQTESSYGRIIAVIYCDGVNINEAVLKAELGEISTFYCNTSEFANEDWAQKYGC